MIPVLIASIMNRPELLDRMLDSVDVDVGRVLVVDNGRIGYQREGVTVATPPYRSLGWAGTFNFAVGQTPEAPWWLYVNNDAWFLPGSLEELVRQVDAERLAVHHDLWTVAAISLEVVDRVGLLDEWTYHPIYFEDTDYAYRCHLAGVPVRQGDWCEEGDLDGQPDHSLTVKSDPELAAANNQTWTLNRAAYIAKWGGPPGRETFARPWDRDVPLWATKPDPWGRLARAWP